MLGGFSGERNPLGAISLPARLCQQSPPPTATQRAGFPGVRSGDAVLGTAPRLALRGGTPGATEVDGDIFERAARVPVTVRCSCAPLHQRQPWCKIAQTLPAADARHGGDGPRPTGASERRHEPRTVGRLQPRPCRSAAPQTRAPGPQNCSSCPPRLASRQASSRAPSRRSSRAPCRTHSRSAGGGSALAGALLGGQTAAVLRVWALSDRPEPGAARVRDGDVELQEALFASREGAKSSLRRPCLSATKFGGLGGGAGLTLDQRKLGILRVPTGTRASS